MSEDIAMLVRAYERGAELAAQDGDGPREELYLELAEDHMFRLTQSFRDQGMPPAKAVVWANCAVLRVDPHEALRASGR